MLICVKSRINELELMKSTLPDSNELISLNIGKSEQNGSTPEAGVIKMVAKIFLNEYSDDSIEEAIENLLKNCSTTPSVILAYHPVHRKEADKFIWADNDAKSKENFKIMWKKLRSARDAGKIGQLGIADMDLETITSIFDDEKFDFTILQINTQTCCVVPPELQQFCKDHEIQLLTHSDPQGEFQQQPD
jgi:glutamate--cysteine ligase regulatory subunit